MEFGERLGWVLLGAAIGFVLGYITAGIRDTRKEVHEIKNEVDEVLDLERHKGEWGILQNRIAFRVAFMLSMFLVFWSAFASYQNSVQLEKNAQDDFVNRCQSGTDSRFVQRSLVDAIYNLATGALQRDPNAPPLTSAEISQSNAYIDRVNDFRVKMYNTIKPSEDCRPYVSDDNVRPPTGPFPHIRSP